MPPTVDDFQKSVVLITGSTSKFGTGFSIRCEAGATWILTCAHVVDDVGGNDHVLVDAKPAQVVGRGEPKAVDLAVLRVPGLEMPPFKLGLAGGKDMPCVIPGCTAFMGGLRKRESLEAVLDGQVDFSECGERWIAAWALRIVGVTPLDGGYSGSPVMQGQTETAFAVASHKEGERGYAISLDHLREIWPEMPPDLLGAASPSFGRLSWDQWTVPQPALGELQNLLRQAAIPDDTVRNAFTAYLKTLGSQATWEPPDDASQPLWDVLFDYLLDPSWMNSSGQPHLLRFVNGLARQARPPFPLRLRKWVGETAAALGIPVPPAPVEDERELPAYLLLALSPEGGYYTLHAWFTSDPEAYDRVYEEKVGVNLDDLPRHLARILAKPKITGACRRGNLPVLEFFLPVGLLNRDLDQWNPFPRDRPLGAHYGLVARAGERLWDKRWLPGWGRYWKQHWDTCGEAVECHTAWLDPRDRHHDAHLHAGRWVFGLSFVPDADCLETLLDAGVGILLWSRRKINRARLDELKAQIAGQRIRDLPEWLRQWRDKRWQDYRETGPLSLLWDDPRRVPDDDQPLPPHPDF